MKGLTGDLSRTEATYPKRGVAATTQRGVIFTVISTRLANGFLRSSCRASPTSCHVWLPYLPIGIRIQRGKYDQFTTSICDETGSLCASGESRIIEQYSSLSKHLVIHGTNLSGHKRCRIHWIITRQLPVHTYPNGYQCPLLQDMKPCLQQEIPVF